jgi:DNA polymerase-3 subunit delta
MAALTSAAALRAVADGDHAPTWYLTGDEDILKQELIAALLGAVLDPSTRDFNADLRHAGDLDGESLTALVDTPPMLAERRVVVVRGLEQWRRNAKVWDTLHRYLAQPNPSTVLVLTHGAGEKPDRRIVMSGVRHVDLAGVSPTERQDWLAKRAKALGADLAPDAARHLMTAVGDDLGLLGRELEKLAAGSSGTITLDQVQALVGVKHGETLPDWVDAVLARDVARATGLVDVVLQQSGVTGVRMVMALGTALVGTRYARALRDAGTGARQLERAVNDAIRAARPVGLRQWGLEARTWARAAERWSGPELDQALADAWQADGALKSTTITDERGILMTLILARAA